MLEIALIGKDGDPYIVEAHPAFIDFRWRDRGLSNQTVYSIHIENFAAPLIAELDGLVALSAYPKLDKARRDAASLARVRSERLFEHSNEDGLRVVELLIPQCRNHPEARIHVTGADRVCADGLYVSIQTQPRFSERSLSVDPLQRGVTWIGEGERMDDVEGIELDPLEKPEITIQEAMRKDRSGPPSSSSSGGRSRQKSATGGAIYVDGPTSNEHLDREREREDRVRQIDAGTYKPRRTSAKGEKSAVVSVRVNADVKAAIDADPEAKRAMFEAVGTALLSGATYASVLESLCHTGGTVP